MTGRAARWAALALAPCLATPGCGVVALAHDKILGPVSPAGRIHPLATGGDFRLGEEGPTASIQGGNPFRLFPMDPIRHLFIVPRTMAQGFIYYAGYLARYVYERDAAVGRPLTPDEVAALEDGAEQGRMTVGEVLDLVGAPQRWIKRREGSLMLYTADASRELAINIGAPPGIGSLIPIPGVGEILRFDYSTTRIDRHRTILFFDADGVLRAASSRRPGEEAAE